MLAKPDEHNRNEDDEMDTRKNKKVLHQKCYHPGNDCHGSVMCSGETMTALQRKRRKGEEGEKVISRLL